MTRYLGPVSGAALLAASLAAGAPQAIAADLGGDCCADLEERVAELEATTARKGNRKVSLEVSGHVNEAVIYWDDGDETNVYVVTNDNARTRFRFKGEAKIDSDWKAGYLIEIGVRAANSKRFDQFTDEAASSFDVGFDIRHSYWYLGSKTYGQLSLGHTGGASEAVTEINLAPTKDIAKYSDVEDSGLGLRLRAEGSEGDSGLSAITWRRLIDDSGDQPGEGERREIVKYDTPTWMGFTGTIAWGEDDFWDIGVRYAGEFNGVKIAAGIAYGENTDITASPSASAAGRDSGFECLTQKKPGSGDAECHQFGGSVSVLHEASGVYVNFAAGILVDDIIDDTVAFEGTGADDDNTFFAVETGIEQKLVPLGKTTFFAQYYHHEGGANDRRAVGATDAINPFFGTTSRIFATEVEMIGGGVVQNIDAAAMSLYAYYRHYEADLTVKQFTAGGGAVKDADLEDLDVAVAGAIIKF